MTTPSMHAGGPERALRPLAAADSAAQERRYFPTLDGWRTIAVLSVIAFHATPPGQPFDALVSRGYLGVNVFFGISGFLITSLLLDEERRGRIDLRAFYVRRAFRIVPPALLYVFAVSLLAVAASASVQVGAKEALGCVFFFRNYLQLTGRAGWATSHYWSLSVEEHFYILWPPVLVLLGKRRALPAALALAFSVAAWRWVDTRFAVTGLGQYGRTDVRIDGLLWGCALALAVSDERWRSFLARRLSARAWLAMVSLFALSTFMRVPAANTLQSVLIPLILYGTLSHPRSRLSRILELKPMRWLGRLSYSLYLWQMLFFMSRFSEPAWFQRFPLNVVLLLGCACASYYLLERPMMQAGRRLGQRSPAAAIGPDPA